MESLRKIGADLGGASTSLYLHLASNSQPKVRVSTTPLLFQVLLNFLFSMVCPLESPDSGGVELFILDLEKWCWSHPLVQGAAPACRLGMAGAAFGSLGEAVNERRLYLFGGVVLRGEQVRIGGLDGFGWVWTITL